MLNASSKDSSSSPNGISIVDSKLDTLDLRRFRMEAPDAALDLRRRLVGEGGVAAKGSPQTLRVLVNGWFKPGVLWDLHVRALLSPRFHHHQFSLLP